ncbi:hypothetical protein ACOMHN_015179 [Nucella lapillus]
MDFWLERPTGRSVWALCVLASTADYWQVSLGPVCAGLNSRLLAGRRFSGPGGPDPLAGLQQPSTVVCCPSVEGASVPYSPIPVVITDSVECVESTDCFRHPFVPLFPWLFLRPSRLDVCLVSGLGMERATWLYVRCPGVTRARPG